MNSFNEKREYLFSLCQLAAEGKLTLDEFDNKWPADLASSFADLLKDDIEDAVEHFPAKLFSKAPDWEMWKKSKLYFSILIDGELLKSGYPEQALVTAKYRLNKIKIKNIDGLKDEVMKALSEQA